MSRKGNPYDNAAVERFFKTLKTEEVYLWEYRSLENVQNRLPFFIQEVYNRKRLQSSQIQTACGILRMVVFNKKFLQTVLNGTA